MEKKKLIAGNYNEKEVPLMARDPLTSKKAIKNVIIWRQRVSAYTREEPAEVGDGSAESSRLGVSSKQERHL